MKALVVYYSLEGSTKRAAELIAKELKADIEELQVLKSISKTGFMKFMWGGRQVVMKSKPQIKDIKVNLNDYDLIVIGTPVWAFSFTPAIRTFFSKYPIDNKLIALFSSHEGGPGKTIQNMKDQLMGNAFVGEYEFLNINKLNDKELETKVKAFVKMITFGSNNK